MPQKNEKVKHGGKLAIHFPFLVDLEYSREWYGGQRRDKKDVSNKKKLGKVSSTTKGRFIFLRHRIGDWVDSGYDYEWREITIWLSSFENDYLDKIEKVIYFLPDSFANPIREKTNRDEKFFTSTAAYGDFNISAEVYLKNKKQPITINRLINVHTSLSESKKPLD